MSMKPCKPQEPKALDHLLQGAKVVWVYVCDERQVGKIYSPTCLLVMVGPKKKKKRGIKTGPLSSSKMFEDGILFSSQ